MYGDIYICSQACATSACLSPLPVHGCRHCHKSSSKWHFGQTRLSLRKMTRPAQDVYMPKGRQQLYTPSCTADDAEDVVMQDRVARPGTNRRSMITRCCSSKQPNWCPPFLWYSAWSCWQAIRDRHGCAGEGREEGGRREGRYRTESPLQAAAVLAPKWLEPKWLRTYIHIYIYIYICVCVCFAGDAYARNAGILLLQKTLEIAAMDATQCPDGAAARLQKYPGILSAAISRRCHRWDGAAEAATWQRRGARPAAR